MARPLLLDLFCGAGGCAVGYHRAGFDVVGVDIRPQPRYPFPFVQADALRPPFDLTKFAVIHASPPCQRYSVAGNINGGQRHPDLVAATRDQLVSTGKPYVIENVPGAPLHFPLTVCGLSLGLRVKRHRLFESNVMLFAPACQGHASGDWVTVFGGGAPAVADNRRRAPVGAARQAMGIDWMSRGELSQAIPPAYTEWIGKQLLRILKNLL